MKIKSPKQQALDLVKEIDNFLPCEGTTTGDTPIQLAIFMQKKIIESSPSLPILGDSGVFGEDIELSTKHHK